MFRRDHRSTHNRHRQRLESKWSKLILHTATAVPSMIVHSNSGAKSAVMKRSNAIVCLWACVPWAGAPSLSACASFLSFILASLIAIQLRSARFFHAIALIEGLQIDQWEMILPLTKLSLPHFLEIFTSSFCSSSSTSSFTPRHHRNAQIPVKCLIARKSPEKMPNRHFRARLR